MWMGVEGRGDPKCSPRGRGAAKLEYRETVTGKHINLQSSALRDWFASQIIPAF